MRIALGAILFTIACCGLADAANILCFLQPASSGQPLWSSPLVKQLAARGHNVYVFAPDGSFPSKGTTKSLHFIGLDDSEAKEAPTPPVNILAWGHFLDVLHWHERQLATCRAMLSNEKALGRLLQLQQSHIDLILYEASSCLLPFAHLFPESPIVAISGHKLTPQLLALARGGSVNAALVPHHLSPFPEKMGFWRRLHNSALYAFDKIIVNSVVDSISQALFSQNAVALKSRLSRDVQTLQRRVKIILSNTHPSIDYVQPLPPNVVQVAGLHIEENGPAGLEELNEFLENAEKGCIYIDLGEGPLDPDLVSAIMDGIRLLGDYNFVWSLANARLVSNKPQNLVIGKRADHSIVLGHPKVLAVVTNGDSLRMIEAAHYGKPALVLPQRFEQLNNAQRAVERGLALRLEASLFAELLLAVLEEGNTYAEASESIRHAFGKRPQTPLATAVWYIEQLLEDPQSFDHLSTEADGALSAFARNSWDIVAVLVMVVGLIVANLVYLTRQVLMGWSQFSKAAKQPTASGSSREERKAAKRREARDPAKPKKVKQK